MFGIFFGLFILITAGLSLCSGISHAVHPVARKLVTLRWLSLSATFACAASTCGGIANTGAHIATDSSSRDLEAIARQAAAGLSETAAGSMVGFALLAVAWLAATVGSRHPSMRNSDGIS